MKGERGGATCAQHVVLVNIDLDALVNGARDVGADDDVLVGLVHVEPQQGRERCVRLGLQARKLGRR